MFSLTQLREQLRRILHLDESPRRTALAFAVGVFIAFSPTYGFHTISVFVVAWAFRLNVAAVLAGSLINNPWTVVPILGATMWTGIKVLGLPDTPPFDWQYVSAKVLYEQIMPYAAPFFVGGLVLSAVSSILAYVVAHIIISRYRVDTTHTTESSDPLPPDQV